MCAGGNRRRDDVLRVAGDDVEQCGQRPCRERRLRAILHPEAVDARAGKRQAELLARHGGREAALARGDLGFSPAPGTKAEMN